MPGQIPDTCVHSARANKHLKIDLSRIIRSRHLTSTIRIRVAWAGDSHCTSHISRTMSVKITPGTSDFHIRARVFVFRRPVVAVVFVLSCCCCCLL